MESASSLPAHETILAKKSVSSRKEKVEGCNLPPHQFSAILQRMVVFLSHGSMLRVAKLQHASFISKFFFIFL